LEGKVHTKTWKEQVTQQIRRNSTHRNLEGKYTQQLGENRRNNSLGEAYTKKLGGNSTHSNMERTRQTANWGEQDTQ
jgi:hypothetical protein